MKAMPLTICPMNDCMRYERNKTDGMCVHAFENDAEMFPGPSCPWPEVPEPENIGGRIWDKFNRSDFISFVEALRRAK